MSVHNLKFIVPENTPVRLVEYLSGEIAAFLQSTEPVVVVSRSKVRRLIIAGAVSIHGRQERRPERDLPPGTEIRIRLDTSRFMFEKEPDDIAFELDSDSVLFEDDWLLIVNKPARFPTEATIIESRDHLHAACKRYLSRNGQHRNTPYCGLLHRLDRETSGVILFSKTRTVNAAIQKQFVDKTIQKMYIALTTPANGHTPGDRFSVQNRLARISPKSTQGKWGAVASGGDEAHTDFELAERCNTVHIVRAWPRTGRTHQIRVHLAGAGLPILGDSLYGGVATLYGIPVPRVMLHAAELTLTHPVSGIRLCVTAPLPQDFHQFWKTRETVSQTAQS